jgi:DNA helicase MCM9
VPRVSPAAALPQAHARLMARREVTRQDAVAAVAVMDCSAGPASILGLCATSSSFAARPDQESAKQERMVLAALGLAHNGLLLEDGRGSQLGW